MTTKNKKVKPKNNPLDLKFVGKICPMMQRECVKGKCELWLGSVVTTENIQAQGRCSLKFLAEKNSDGLLPV